MVVVGLRLLCWRLFRWIYLRVVSSKTIEVKFSWTTKAIAIMMLIAFCISFPFFKIKFFETTSTYKIIYNYFLIPIVSIASLGTIFTYVKFLRKFNKKTHSKLKVILQDVLTSVFLIFIVSAILLGLTLSSIVTTNAYCDRSKEFRIVATVESYEAYTTKWGRLRHYIIFTNPVNKSEIRLEVFRKYEIGESFIKDMKLGKWGQLYSVD